MKSSGAKEDSAVDLKQVLKDCGYNVVAELDVSTLEFLPEVRAMCSADRCRAYGKSWSCPPANGTLEYWEEKASHFRKGLLMQTVGEREDSFDFEAMMEVEELHKANSEKLIDFIHANALDCLFMTAGTCTRCKPCTYPDAPCRFPDRVFPSMEACGVFVSKVCMDINLAYNYGDEKIAYTSCLLYND